MTTKTIKDLVQQLEIQTRITDEARAQFEAELRKVEALKIVIELMQEAADQEDADVSPPGKQLKNEMYAILHDTGRPLHYSAIYEALQQRGVHVPGRDPKRNVGAHLSADQRFARFGNGEWGLASWLRLAGDREPRLQIDPFEDEPTSSQPSQNSTWIDRIFLDDEPDRDPPGPTDEEIRAMERSDVF